MATRTCPSCGAQYVASVRLCIDCGEPLVEDRSTAADAGEPGPGAQNVGHPEGLGRTEGDRVVYDLVGWGNSLKVSLAGILERAAVKHVWEAGALVISTDDETQVDEVIAGLGGIDAEADAGDGESLVAFEIEGLTGEDQEELDARLLAAGLSLTWSEEGDLIVPEADQDRVAQIIDEVLGEDDDGDEAGADGLAVNAALSALFVATDRLSKSPGDDRTARAYRDAATVIAGLGVPYGMARADWLELVAEVNALAVRSEGEPDDDPGPDQDDDPDHEPDDGVAAAARDLRERLREMV